MTDDTQQNKQSSPSDSSPGQTHDNKVDESGQPFLEHLLELRQRILRGLVSIFVLFIPAYYFANDIFEYIATPLMVHLPEGSTMIATEVASPFLTPFKTAVFTAIFVAMPYTLHQLWAFVSPGLYLKEKRFARPLLVSSIALFYAGMVFAYYLVFPLMFKFFAGVTPEGVTMMTDINLYLNFVIKLFFAFGAAFEIPVLTLLLVWSGISTVESLTKKRPFIVVGCFVLGMLFTPPDVVSQVMLAGPMWLLFEVGIIFARLTTKDDQDSPT